MNKFFIAARSSKMWIACGIFLAAGMRPHAAQPSVTSESNPQLKAYFQQHPDAEANHDGILTEDEARAYYQKSQSPSPGAAKPPEAPATNTARPETIANPIAGTPVSPTGEPPYAEYLHNPEGYQWKLNSKTAGPTGGMVYTLNLTSQIWHGATWTHQPQVFVPKNNIAPDVALIYVETIRTDAAGLAQMAQIADGLGITCVLTDGIYQACFGVPAREGMIAYATRQYLKTGDPTWLPTVPAAKSLVRTMDAVEEFSGRDLGAPIHRFILIGHSKMGMASWTTSASDPRVKGIIPMGADMLNLQANKKLLGAFEAAVGSSLDSDAGRKFLTLFDPFTYRQKLTAAKLVITGADDATCDPNAINPIWARVPDPKWHLYLDNANHGQEAQNPKSFRGILAFTRAIALKKDLPKIEWKFAEKDGKLKLQVTTSVPAQSAQLWSATGPFDVWSVTGSFASNNKWTSQPMQAEAGGTTFSGEVAKPPTGVAAYAELEFPQEGSPLSKSYVLTTALQVTP